MPRGASYQANMAYSDPAFIPGYTPYNYTFGFNMFTPGHFHSSSPYFSGNVPNGVPSTSGPSTQATCAANLEIGLVIVMIESQWLVLLCSWV